MGSDNYHWALIGRSGGGDEPVKQADCGCGARILYCPLHAAAPALAEALEKLTARIAMWKRGVAEGIEVLAVAEEASAALEAARGRG